MRPPFDVELIDQLTPSVISEGYRMLQTHRYGASEREHVALLLDAFRLPDAAVVVDMGCGLGEVARLMHAARADLRFILVNLSAAQLQYCQDVLADGPFMTVLVDAHATHLPVGFADGVMFNSALCQMDECVALGEAFRVLARGGRLLVNELVRTAGDGREMERELACRTWSEEALCRAIERMGFEIDFVAHPSYSMEHFHELLARKGLQHLGQGVCPVVVTATVSKV